MTKLSAEEVMTIKVLTGRVSNRALATQLGVCEGTVRYHQRRQARDAADGRQRQLPKAAALRPAIDAWLEAQALAAPDNVAALYDWLVAEHGYTGSLRGVQRYVGKAFPAPTIRARRRVETPPGAQAQADWGHFPRVWIDGLQRDLLAFVLQLSFSRFDALIWAERKDLMSWLWVHNRAFAFLGGVPATVRVDNEKTAISRGAGAWGEINATYRRYAQTLRFHVDACPPRAPQAKGKVERRIRARRGDLSPYRRHWRSLAELQTHTDARLLAQARQRPCPARSGSVYDAWQEERVLLAPVDSYPEPFDVAVLRTVAHDCTVQFAGKTWSVPFALVGRTVEVRGTATAVQIFHGCECVATHPRHTALRIVLDPAHFEGPSTARVIAPLPLGRMGRRLAEIAALAPECRPLDLYAALAEVAR